MTNSKKILFVILIFAFSLSLRLWNLNQMGRTWDEHAYVEVGYKFVQLLAKGDFKNNFFYNWADEPPLARYIYGFSEVFGKKQIQSDGKVLFNYDYTYPRLASSILSSLSVVLVVLIGWEFISYSVGIFSGTILSMLPLFLGYSQIATLESVLFFTFTASIYSFLRFLKKGSYTRALIAGLFLGFAILSKFTNILLIPIFISVVIIWKKYSLKRDLSILKKLPIVFISSIVIFFTLWPMPLFDLGQVISYNYNLRSELGQHPSIEIFFGRLMHVPVFYYPIYFLITTPLLLLVFFLIGSKYISDYGRSFDKLNGAGKRKDLKWIFYSLILWFCLVFIQSFYNFRQHGIRYIIEIYAPFAIITALGFDYLVSKIIKKNIQKIILFASIIFYLFVILIGITPYYLEYFNIVVGGTKNVYNSRLFQIGWWGQGAKEAGDYIKKQAPGGSKIGLAISPIHVFPQSQNYKVFEYNPKVKYDYVVVSYFHVLREGFDDTKIKHEYNLVYTVKADGASLMWVYESK